MNITVTKRNVKPSATQIAEYRLNKVVQRAHVPNLRFGKIAFTTDADVDG
jgi:DNA gyrase/topoisomerase IV subunit B